MAPRPEYTMTELPLPDEHPDWAEYYKNIADVIRGNGALIVTPEQALRVMRVVDLMFKADAEGGAQRCSL